MESEQPPTRGAARDPQDTGATRPGDPQRARVTRELEPATDARQVSVARSSWIKDEDYWRKITYMSATGRRPGASPTPRTLPRPDRFRRWSPLASLIVMALVVGLIVVVPVGIVLVERAAASFSLPSIPGIPGVSPPTATPTEHGGATPTLPAK